SVNIVSDVTGGTTCAKTFTRTWLAIDVCGNSSSTVSQTITVTDTTPPTIGSAGANTTVEGCPQSFTPTFTAPTASDNCSGAITPTVVSDVTGGTSCAKTFTRTWIAVDGCGNSSGTVAQTITVTDTTPPTIGSVGASTTVEGCPQSFTPTFT